jgi:hypothetical protein
MEAWKDIDLTNFGGEDYTGLYELSNSGKIRSLERMQWNELTKRVIVLKERILKNKLSHEYHRIQLCKNGDIKNYQVHRLVGFLFVPNLENKPQINHKDGVKLNNWDWNLEWSTGSENQKHAFKTGLRNNRGENHSQHKLKEKDILKIRELYKTGKYRYIDLADIFKISWANIACIVTKRSWKHI